MQPKIVSIVGAGGKTTALRALARAQVSRRVLVTTTTHMFPVPPPDCRTVLTDPVPDVLLAQLQLPGAVCAGRQAESGKLCALPPALLTQAAAAADIVLCEADGAHRLPLKLHRADEPVLPPQTDLCLIVAGLSALGRPIRDAVHRYALCPDWAANPEQLVGIPELLYCVREAATACGLPKETMRVLLNQADTPALAALAEPAATALAAEGLDCRIGSLYANPDLLHSWIFSE